MRYQDVVLLALCSNLIKAGPVQRFERLAGRNLTPRFLNETKSATPITSSAIPSSSSDETIPFSSDASLESSVPSRISTTKNGGNIEGKEGAGSENGALSSGNENAPSTIASPQSTTSGPSSLSPITDVEAAQSAPPTSLPAAGTSQSTVSTPSSSSQSKIAGAQSPSNEGADGNNASTGLPSPSNNLSPGGSLESISSAALANPSTTVNAADTSAASQAVADNGGAAMSAFQQARGSQRLETPSSPPSHEKGNIGKPSTASAVPSAMETSSAPTPSTDTPKGYTVSQSSDGVVGVGNVASVASEATAPTASINQASTSTVSNAAPSGGFRGDPQVSDETARSGGIQNIAESSSSASSVFGQVPTSVLDTPAQTSSTASPSGSQQSLARPSKEALPDASVGSSKMAQGYNSVFQGLDPTSRCDPNNKKEASACIRGQPGKCESDGTYTLISCDMGETCYAVPKGNGESGVSVGCYTPKDYQAMISGDQSSANKQQASQASSASASQESAASAAQTGDSSAAQSANSASGAAHEQDDQAQTVGIPPLPSTQTAATTQSSALPSSVANVPPAAFAAHEGGSQTSGPKQDDFPEPKASAKGDQAPAVASSAEIASATAIPSATVGGHSSPTQQVAPGDGPSTQPSSQSSHSKGNDGTPSSKGSDSNKDQNTKSDHSNDDNSKKPSKSDSKDNGVELSFPGSNDSGSKDNSKGSKHDSSSDDHKDGPQTNQKNVAAPADVVSSSIPVPTSSTPPPQNTPAVTAAPSAPADGFKGYITVTVTETVTVHD